MSTIPRKVFIQVDSSEEQESVKNARKTLKVLQKEATNKENLVGRSILPDKFSFKKSKSETAVNVSTPTSQPKRRKSSLSQDSAEKQSELTKITEEDLTTEGEPSEGYWKVLAEKRRIALDISLKENEELHEKIASLEEELNISRAMLDETKNLVEVLTEMVQENDPNDSGFPHHLNSEYSQSMINTTIDTDTNTEDDTDTCDENIVDENVSQEQEHVDGETQTH